MLAGFPSLVPAYTILLAIAPGLPVGTPRNSALTYVAITPGTGFIRSEPGYAHQLDAVVEHGGDWIRADSDGKHMRLDVHALARDRATGAPLKFSYTGTLKMGGESEKVLNGAPDAKTTDFGEIVTHVTFEATGPLVEVSNKEFVGSGRFILEDGKVSVEYKVSEVKP